MKILIQNFEIYSSFCSTAVKGNSSIKQMDEDTSIIIVANLTPSAPRIDLVVLALECLVFVKGHSTAPPIYIIVDGMAEEEETLRKKKSFFQLHRKTGNGLMNIYGT